MLPAAAATAAHLDVLEAALKTARLALAAATTSAPTLASVSMAVEPALAAEAAADDAAAAVAVADGAAVAVAVADDAAGAVAVPEDAPAAARPGDAALEAPARDDDTAEPAAKRARPLVRAEPAVLTERAASAAYVEFVLARARARAGSAEHSTYENEYLPFVPANLSTLVLASQSGIDVETGACQLAARVTTGTLHVRQAGDARLREGGLLLAPAEPAATLLEAQARAHTRFEHELAYCSLLQTRTMVPAFPEATLLVVVVRYARSLERERESIFVLVGTDRRLASATATWAVPACRDTVPRPDAHALCSSQLDCTLQRALAAWFAPERLVRRLERAPTASLQSAALCHEGGLHALVDVLESQVRAQLEGRACVRLNPRPPGNEHGVMVMGDVTLAAALADRLRCRVLELQSKKLPPNSMTLARDAVRIETSNGAYAYWIKRTPRPPPRDAINVIIVTQKLSSGNMLAGYARLLARLPFSANLVLALVLEVQASQRPRVFARRDLAGMRIAVAF